MGDHAYALFDRLPEGTLMALTVVVIPQDRLENRINVIQSRAVGEGIEARQTREDAETVKDYLVSEHKLYRMHLAFYASGSTLEELRSKTNRLCSVLLSHVGADCRDDYSIGSCNLLFSFYRFTVLPYLSYQGWWRLRFTVQYCSL